MNWIDARDKKPTTASNVLCIGRRCSNRDVFIGYYVTTGWHREKDDGVREPCEVFFWCAIPEITREVEGSIIYHAVGKWL
jgi:hypothetical protein